MSSETPAMGRNGGEKEREREREKKGSNLSHRGFDVHRDRLNDAAHGQGLHSRRQGITTSSNNVPHGGLKARQMIQDRLLQDDMLDVDRRRYLNGTLDLQGGGVKDVCMLQSGGVDEGDSGAIWECLTQLKVGHLRDVVCII